MFIKRYGSGADHFLCLHGWSGDHLTFEPLVRFMPVSASIFAADLPGCGLSTAPAHWRLSAIAGEIAQTFKDVARSLTLVGNCIGALLGVRAALEDPNAVHRLVLIDAFASWPWYFRVFTAPRWGRYAYDCTFANPAGRWITNRALAGKRSADSDLTRGFAAVRHDVALRYLHVLRELESVDNFSGLRVPVDIIFGARTFRAIRESAVVWQSIWPWARIFEVPRAGHLPIREAAAEISHIVFEGRRMSAAIRDYVEHHSPMIDRALRALLPVSKLGGTDCLNEAIEYALFGGKHMRPVLALLAAEICGAAPAAALPVACAVEFLHAASLALDDLPAMDDAGLRRGRATVHVRYGEELAILASLALLNEAYGIFARYPGLLSKAVQEIGIDGMIGGQAADVCRERCESRTEKTTALMRLGRMRGPCGFRPRGWRGLSDL